MTNNPPTPIPLHTSGGPVGPVPSDAATWETPADLGRPTLLMRRWGPLSGPPVLLLHGLSAQSNTFETNERRGHHLAAWLRTAGYTVWLVDYRGSGRPSVIEKLEALAADEPQRATAGFRFGATARHDVGGAIRHVSAAHGDRPVHVVAHCVGGGLTALALALEPELPVGNLVLSTLGLFYRVPFVREVKIWSMIGEYFRAEAGQHWLDPWDAAAWGDPDSAYHYLAEAEQAWRRVRWGRLGLAPRGCETFVRLSFLFGEPYDPERLPELHREAQAYDADRGRLPPALRSTFGRLNLGLMIDVAENLRAGRPTAECLPRSDADPPPDPARETGQLADDPSVTCPIDGEGDRFCPEAFLERHVLLLTGRHNRLWHPNSMATMHGWLLDRGADPTRLRRRTLPGYAHQDLLWAATAWDEVYPLIGATLAGR